MDTMKALRIAACLVPLAGLATQAQAVDYTPQVGTWLIDEEFNGKPGRGFQMDVQNDVLVLYFYGYEQTGESTFWLAAGTLQSGSNQLTMDLGTYQGGMAFGDPLKNATYLGAEGTVTVRFNSTNRGEICLPKESCKAISAMNFGFDASAQELLGTWLVVSKEGDEGTDGLDVVFDTVLASTDPAVVDVATGSAEVDVEDDMTVEGDVRCERLVNAAPWRYRCTVTGGGEVIPFRLSAARNGFVGVVLDPQGGTLANLTGFRVRTATGRVVLPN